MMLRIRAMLTDTMSDITQQNVRMQKTHVTLTFDRWLKIKEWIFAKITIETHEDHLLAYETKLMLSHVS